jgi:putative tryptophan/tyrosine transport system substrate-binding protein
MRRRSFIGGLLGVAMTKKNAAAQVSEHVQRIGTLMPLSPITGAGLQTDVAVFEQALNALGWKVGVNPLVESRWASDHDGMRTAARELVRLEPNVLLVGGAALPSAVEATQTIPIVFVLASDERVQRYVKNFARPSGNATGFTSYEMSLVGKRLELLKEVVPRINQVAFLHSAMNVSTQMAFQELAQASPSLAVKIIDGRAENGDEIERTVRFVRDRIKLWSGSSVRRVYHGESREDRSTSRGPSFTRNLPARCFRKNRRTVVLWHRPG